MVQKKKHWKCSTKISLNLFPNKFSKNFKKVFLYFKKIILIFQISDVSPLRNNIHYRYVVDVHLENNLVENIDVLEGGYWLEHFRLLNLKNNKLKKVCIFFKNFFP